MTKKLFAIALISTYTSVFSQVGINTQNPDPSAVLDVSSDTKGILVPRLSSTAVNDLSSTASEGLIVYNKEQKAFLGWDGSKWQNLGYEEINTVPTATNLSIAGTYSTGSLLTANYTFSDAQSNPDDASTFVWKRADNGTGTNTVIIPAATSQNYTLAAADQNKYIQVCVTPGSSIGASPGNFKCSAWGGPVSLNQAPTASNVNISGTATQGQTLTGVYTYSDNEGNAQGTSTFRWTRSDDASGTNETAISGATTKNYTLTATDVNKYIKFYVTPVATTGATHGTETGSPYKGPIAVLTLTSGDVFNEGFESGTANGYFTVTNTAINGNSGVVTGNSAAGWTPSNSPKFASGTRGYQMGGTASATASSVFVSPVIDATQYTNNMTFSMKVAAFGTASGSGLDSGSNDFVLVEVSSNGGTTYAAGSVQVGGNNNATWAFGATGSTSVAYGSDFSQNSSSGNNLTNGPSTLTITGIPNTVSQLRFRITVKHNQTAAQDEYWVVDDIKLVAP